MPVDVYEVIGAGPVRSRLQVAAARGLTRFVGRDPELDTLRQLFERAGAGQGQMVAVIGEPGVGQSEDGLRLLADAQEVMARTDERFYGAELSRLTGVLHLAHSPAAQAEAEGELRWALYVTISPTWFDPGQVAVVGGTPFWFAYALHDALLKPMPDNPMAPSLAESWTVSDDQRAYEFTLREGLTFHNGDPFTAEDVKFTFLRYKSTILQEKVREVEIVDPYRVRFHLHQPWPDFMAYYGTLATGAGWIVVPKKYLEQVGDDGFKKHPIGLGPYKFVSHMPGVELVMEANERYWRKVPHVKRLVFKSVTEGTTRLAMLKKGEVDVAYDLDVPAAEEVKRDPKLRLAFSGGIGSFYLDFLE